MVRYNEKIVYKPNYFKVLFFLLGDHDQCKGLLISQAPGEGLMYEKKK